MPTSSLKLKSSSNERKCVPHESPIPAKFQGDIEKMKGAQVPEFTSLVNFPSQQKELPEGMRCCVMCGQTCPCSSSSSSSSSNKNKNSTENKDPSTNTPPPVDDDANNNKRRAAAADFAIIPTQNKGLCKLCDVNVWVVCQSGLQIKWCKGCKNFRPWAAFGDKGLATKCLRCRERQREHYALQKEEKEKAPTTAPPTIVATTTTTATTATATSTMATPTTPQEKHLGWSNKQGRILTANGKALDYYTAERGFPFEPQELPHHHLGKNNTRSAFASWDVPKTSLVCGAWKRPLFCGEWEHSTEEDETAYNVQTNSLFVDLRIPTTRSQVLPADCISLASLTNEQLAFYARQHVFGGFSKLNRERYRDVCTRLHCMDWNYVGTPRPRPNKWWIEIYSNNKNVWKEWAYATDDHGQHYYMERWERLEGGSPTVRLALRKADGGDGILVVVGDHFNYLLDRQLTGKEKLYGKSSLVDVVDAALAQNDRATAEAFLSIDAGHGFTAGWKIDAAIQPWKEGTALLSSRDDVSVVGDSLKDCHVLWNKERWDVYECSLKTPGELVSFLCSSKRR